MTRDDAVRLRITATTIALVLALLGNGAGLVWFASKLSATVESTAVELKATSTELRQTLTQVGQSVQDLRERVGVLEDRGNRTQASSPLTAH